MRTTEPIITKEKAVIYMLRLTTDNCSKKILLKSAKILVKLSNAKFIKEFRKVTELKLCSFGGNKYYINYN